MPGGGRLERTAPGRCPSPEARPPPTRVEFELSDAAPAPAQNGPPTVQVPVIGKIARTGPIRTYFL